EFSLMPRMRKGAVQIRFEILEFLYYRRRQLRTHIWRKATSLSYDDFLKHLSYLREKDLVLETDDGLCKITERGRGVYEELRNALSSIL
ncbi:MAG: winged helix-turn-helix domain-containing protein, partial [Candidatus Bathyarchaeota archaeon]|nr:winged helix-turn-helix domain-containing protein [Candidatus Bathyarchaeota archaeon]